MFAVKAVLALAAMMTPEEVKACIEALKPLTGALNQNEIAVLMSTRVPAQFYESGKPKNNWVRGVPGQQFSYPDYITVIKQYRVRTGCRLSAAKDAVDAWIAQNGGA